jgi:hypothetical protein
VKGGMGAGSWRGEWAGRGQRWWARGPGYRAVPIGGPSTDGSARSGPGRRGHGQAGWVWNSMGRVLWEAMARRHYTRGAQRCGPPARFGSGFPVRQVSGPDRASVLADMAGARRCSGPGPARQTGPARHRAWVRRTGRSPSRRGQTPAAGGRRQSGWQPSPAPRPPSQQPARTQPPWLGRGEGGGRAAAGLREGGGGVGLAGRVAGEGGRRWRDPSNPPPRSALDTMRAGLARTGWEFA